MGQVSDVIRRIQRWIEAVDFEEAEKNYLAANLQWAALLTGASCVLAGGVYAFVIQRPYTVAVLLISFAFYLAVVWLVRRRHLTSASALYLSAMLGIVTYELHMANGIRSIGVILYPVVVIFASLILSRRLFILYVGLVLASVGSVIYGQMQGWVQVAALEPPSFAVFLLYSLIVSGTGLVVRMLAESWRAALARAQRNERELAAQKAMLDRVGQAVVGCQADSTIVYWNQAAADLYGWRAEEAVGRKYYEVVPTPLSPETTESIRASLRQGTVWSGEMTVRRRDDTSVPILGTLAPLHDERGVMTGWVGIAADLAERTRADEAVRQRADEMSLLYRMGISLAAGHDLPSTLNALQAEISALIRADAMFIAIYDEDTDIMSYPVYFNAGEPAVAESRRLQDRPGLTGVVINSGKTLYLPDIMMPQVQETFAPVDDNALILHTFLGVPLVLKERSMGVISVQSSRVDAFTPEQIQLVENIAVQAAIAIDKARLFDQLGQELAERKRAEQAARRRADEAALLYDLSIALSAGQDLYQVLRSLLEYIRRLFALNSFYVGIYDDERGLLQFPLFWNDGEFLHPAPRDLRATPGFSGEVILGRRRVYISDLEDPQVIQELQVVATAPSRNRSLVGIPLIAQDRVTGMFSIQSRQANAYTPDQIHLLEALAAQVAIAIDKAHLFGQLEQELAERKRAEAGLRESEARFRGLFHHSMDAVILIDQDGRVAEINPAAQALFQLTPDETLGRPVWDMQASRLTEADKQVISADAIRDGLVNILRTGQSPQTPHALVSDIQLPDGQIRTVQQTWFAIPHGEQFRIASVSRDVTEQKQADALRVQAEAERRTGAMRQRLLDFSRELLSTVEVEEILEIIRRTALDLAPHDVFAPYWVDEAAGVLRPVETQGRRWFSAPQFHTWTIPLGQGIMGDAARKQRAECVNNSHLDPRSIYPPGFREQMAHEHSIILPIRSGEKMQGVLALTRRTGSAFTPDEFELAQLLMSQAELALSNARMFAELEQRVAERTAQLAASEERYRNFIENSSEGIWRLAFDAPIPLDLPPEDKVHHIQQHGYVAECNDALARMYGYSSRREMLGKRLLELYGGQASEQNTRATRMLVESGYRSSNRETREVNRQGETVYFSNNAVGIIHGNLLVGVWGTQRDVTGLKQVEAEREKLIKELQTKNDELERFTYTVSHDLKAPLVTIRGFAGFLEKDLQAGKPDRAQSDITRILGATDKMQRLLNELLELSRIGRMMNPPQAVPFETIAREAAELVRGRLQARGVRVEIASGLPTVYGDRTRLIQALQNLVDNAAKFMGSQANPRIEIGTSGADTDGKPILFVRDNGIGIAPQDAEHVFGLFNKLDAQAEGTGVGLALVKRIVEVHGGKIWVESEGIGHGATFCLTLPTAPVEIRPH